MGATHLLTRGLTRVSIEMSLHVLFDQIVAGGAGLLCIGDPRERV